MPPSFEGRREAEMHFAARRRTRGCSPFSRRTDTGDFHIRGNPICELKRIVSSTAMRAGVGETDPCLSMRGAAADHDVLCARGDARAAGHMGCRPLCGPQRAFEVAFVVAIQGAGRQRAPLMAVRENIAPHPQAFRAGSNLRARRHSIWPGGAHARRQSRARTDEGRRQCERDADALSHSTPPVL